MYACRAARTHSQQFVVEVDLRGHARSRQDPAQVEGKQADDRQELPVNRRERYFGDLRKLRTGVAGETNKKNEPERRDTPGWVGEGRGGV